jgi:hypothetical protein
MALSGDDSSSKSHALEGACVHRPHPSSGHPVCGTTENGVCGSIGGSPRTRLGPHVWRTGRWARLLQAPAPWITVEGGATWRCPTTSKGAQGDSAPARDKRIVVVKARMERKERALPERQRPESVPAPVEVVAPLPPPPAPRAEVGPREARPAILRAPAGPLPQRPNRPRAPSRAIRGPRLRLIRGRVLRRPPARSGWLAVSPNLPPSWAPRPLSPPLVPALGSPGSRGWEPPRPDRPHRPFLAPPRPVLPRS